MSDVYSANVVSASGERWRLALLWNYLKWIFAWITALVL